MFQVRIHGRGGQGVVTAAEMLSVAAFIDGRYSQAFPSFGSERMGAPVAAFCRIDDRTIRSHEPVVEPDALIVQDPTLLHHIDVFAGLAQDGYVLINSSRSPDELGIAGAASDLGPERLLTVPATEMALRVVGRPVPNTVLLGGLVALTAAVSLEGVTAAISRRFRGPVAEANIAAARAAFEFVNERKGVSSNA